MRIFISFASEDRGAAEELFFELINSGYEAFYDKESLSPGRSFTDWIRGEVERCDLLVFLLSPHSVQKGNYALTELKYVRSRWRSPEGHVLPVMVREIPKTSIPPYLSRVTVLEPEGNLVAETVMEIHKLAKRIESAGNQDAGATTSEILLASRSASPASYFTNRTFLMRFALGVIIASSSYILFFVAASERPRLPLALGTELTEYLKQNMSWRETSHTATLVRPRFVLTYDSTTGKLTRTELKSQVKLEAAVARPITVASLGLAALAAFVPDEIKWVVIAGATLFGVTGYIAGTDARQEADDERLVAQLCDDNSLWETADQELRQTCVAIRTNSVHGSAVAKLIKAYPSLGPCREGSVH